jgi:GDP-L-fucose synthase
VSEQRVFVAGHRGLVGSAIVRALRAKGYAEPITRTRHELDLTDQRAVQRFVEREQPSVIFLAAAKVGGIKANDTWRWDFLYQNLLIEVNVLGAAQEYGVDRVIFLGSSCIYPKLAPQPIREGSLLTGLLEPTNEPYAIAKIAGLKLVESAAAQFGRCWVSLMPTNLYGPGDNYDAASSHVIPGMIQKFHEAKIRSADGSEPVVRLWGTGKARREFLHVDDLAAAALLMLENRETGLYNVGSGSELTIAELAELVASIIEFRGRVEWDTRLPDGTPRKLLDSSRIRAFGWAPRIDLREGLAATYRDFVAQHSYV